MLNIDYLFSYMYLGHCLFVKFFSLNKVNNLIK